MKKKKKSFAKHKIRIMWSFRRVFHWYWNRYDQIKQLFFSFSVDSGIWCIRQCYISKRRSLDQNPWITLLIRLKPFSMISYIYFNFQFIFKSQYSCFIESYLYNLLNTWKKILINFVFFNKHLSYWAMWEKNNEWMELSSVFVLEDHRVKW